MTIISETMAKKTNVAPPGLMGTPATNRVAVRPGDDAFLLVFKTPGSGPILQLTWAKGSRPLIGDRYRVGENNNTVHLTLEGATQEDAGEYTVTAKNIAGESRSSVHLRIKDDDDDTPVFLRRLNDLAVKVGTRTRFLVEIPNSSDVKVTWHRNDITITEDERYHVLHEGNFFCVDVAPVAVEDSGRWTCMAENQAGRATCSCRLNVIVPRAYKAPEFMEELRAILTEQGTVSLECKVVGVPTPLLRWFKDGKEIKAGDVFALSANAADPTSLGTYTCEATNCMGKTYSSSRVHVVGRSREGSLQLPDNVPPCGPPPRFHQTLQEKKVKIGTAVTLSCAVAVPPWPRTIAWYNKEGHIDCSEKYHIMEDGLGGYSIEIFPVEVVDEGEWKCVATSEAGVKGITQCHLSVTYLKNYRKPRFLESLKAILTDEGLVSFECKVVGFPTPQLQWFKDGNELRPGDVYQLTGTNSLGSYSCVARNCMGEASSSAELTVEDIQNQLNDQEKSLLLSLNQPPKFVVGLKSCEAKINEPFRFTVQVTISPEPKVAWYRDDEQLEVDDRYEMTRESLGVCHLDIRCVEIADQAEWKCVATNKFGHTISSGFLKLTIPRHFKTPRFLECLQAILTETGAVNLECKVIGVPQPTLKWYKDGRELKPGDIHKIITGEDGTCCLGTYTCEAHNCMGSISSSASLLGFEERVSRKQPLSAKMELPYPLAKNASLSTIHEERTSQLFDTPATDHSVTLDERGDVSFSFDGKEVSISLYETPDLTEDEALQVVEMYAEELSENVSEHNIVELPPLRFTKESSKSGPIVMEAVVIDVTPEYFSSADEDLRTEADFEDVSMTDELTHQLLSPAPTEEDIFEKIDAEFLEKALAPLTGLEKSLSPDEPESFHSIPSPRKSSKKSRKLSKDETTLSLDLETETFASAKGSVNASKKVKKSRSRSNSMDPAKKSFDEKVEEGIVTVTPKKKSRSSSVTSQEKMKLTRTKSGSMGKEEGKGKKLERSKSGSVEPGEDQQKKKIARSISRSSGEEDYKSDKKLAVLNSTSIETLDGDQKMKIVRSKSGSVGKEVDKGVKKLARSKSGSIEPAEGVPKKNIIKSKSKSVDKEDDNLKNNLNSSASDGVEPMGSVPKKRIARSKSRSLGLENEKNETVHLKSGSVESTDGEAKKKVRRSTSGSSLSVERQGTDILTHSQSESINQGTKIVRSKSDSIEREIVVRSTSEKRRKIVRSNSSSIETGEPPETRNIVSRSSSASKVIDDEHGRKKSTSASSGSLDKEFKKKRIVRSNSGPVDEATLAEGKQRRVKKSASVSSVGSDDSVDRSSRKGSIDPKDQVRLRQKLIRSTSSSLDNDTTEKRLRSSRSSSTTALKNREGKDSSETKSSCISSSVPNKKGMRSRSGSTHETAKNELQASNEGIKNIQLNEKFMTLTQGNSDSIGDFIAPEIKVSEVGRESQVSSLHLSDKELRKIGSPVVYASVSNSLKEIQRNLTSIEERISQKSEEYVESERAKSNLATLDALSFPIQEIQKGLIMIEKQVEFEHVSERPISPELSLLDSLARPIQDFEIGLKLASPLEQVETTQALEIVRLAVNHLQDQLIEAKDKALSQPGTDDLVGVLNILSTPVEDLLLALWDRKATLENFEMDQNVAEQSQSSVELLRALAQPVQDLQSAIELAERQAKLQGFEETLYERPCAKLLESLNEPMKNLKAAIKIIEEQSKTEVDEDSVSEKILETVSGPIEEISRGLTAIEEQAHLEESQEFDSPLTSQDIIETLASPIHSLHKGLAQIVQDVLFPSKRRPSVDNAFLALANQIQKNCLTICSLVKTIGPDTSETYSERRSTFSGLQEPLSLLGKALSDVMKSGSPQDVSDVISKPLKALSNNLFDIEQKLEATDGGFLLRPENMGPMIGSLKRNVISILFETEMESNEKSLHEIFNPLAQSLQDLQAHLGGRKIPPLQKSGSSLGKSLELIKQASEDDRGVTQENSVEEPKVSLAMLRPLEKPLQDLEEGLGVITEQIGDYEGGAATEGQLHALLEVLSQSFENFQEEWVKIEAIETESKKPLAEAKALISLVGDLKVGAAYIEESIRSLGEINGNISELIDSTVTESLVKLKKSLIEVEGTLRAESIDIIPELKVLKTSCKKLQDAACSVMLRFSHFSVVLNAVATPLANFIENLQKSDQVDASMKLDMNDIVCTGLSGLEKDLLASNFEEANIPPQMLRLCQDLRQRTTESLAQKASAESIGLLSQTIEQLSGLISEGQPAEIVTTIKCGTEISTVDCMLTDVVTQLCSTINVIEEVQSSLLIIEPLTEPLQQITSKLSAVQASLVDQSSAVVLQNLVQPLKTLQEGLEKSTEEEKLVVLGIVKESVAEMMKAVSNVQQQTALRLDDDGLPEVTQPLLLETLMEPVEYLHKCLKKIEHSIVEVETPIVPEQIPIEAASAVPYYNMEEQFSADEDIRDPGHGKREDIFDHDYQKNETEDTSFIRSVTARDEEINLPALPAVSSSMELGSDFEQLTSSLLTAVECTKMSEQGSAHNDEVSDNVQLISQTHIAISDPHVAFQGSDGKIESTVLESVSSNEVLASHQLIQLESSEISSMNAESATENTGARTVPSFEQPSTSQYLASKISSGSYEPEQTSNLEAESRKEANTYFIGETQKDDGLNALVVRAIPAQINEDQDISIVESFIKSAAEDGSTFEDISGADDKSAKFSISTELEWIEQDQGSENFTFTKKQILPKETVDNIREITETLKENFECENGRSQISTFQLLEKPLQEISEALESLKPVDDITPVVVQLQDIAEYLSNVEGIFLDITNDIDSSDRSLTSIALPLEKLNKDITLLQESTTVAETNSQFPDFSSIKAVTESIHELQIAILETQKTTHQSECEGSLDLARSGDLCGEEVNLLTSNQEPEDCHLQSVVCSRDASIISAIAEPMQELETILVQIREHMTLETDIEPLQVSILETLSEPIRELHIAVENIENTAAQEAVDSVFAENTRKATLSTPIYELHRGLALIQQQMVLIDPVELEQSQALIVLESLAGPIEILYKEILAISEDIPYEPDALTLSEKSDISQLKVFATPIEEVRKLLAVIEQFEVMEPEPENLVAIDNLPTLISLAQPIQNLQNSVEQIEQFIIENTSLTEEQYKPIIEAVARPVDKIDRFIAVAQNELYLKDDTELLVKAENLSLLKKLAAPLHELAQSLSVLEQQVIEPAAKSLRGDSLIVEPVLASTRVATPLGQSLVAEQMVFEGDVTSFNVDPVQKMNAIERSLTMPELAPKEVLSASETEVLKSLTVEGAAEEAMARETLESLRSTALIERQEVLESGIATGSYVSSLSDRGDWDDEDDRPRLESLPDVEMDLSWHTDDGILLKNANVGLHSDLEALMIQDNVAEYNVASLAASSTSPTIADQSVKTALAVALKEEVDEQELMETLSDVDSLSKIEDIDEESDKGALYPEATITLITHDAVEQRIISAQSVPTQFDDTITAETEARGTIEAALGIAQIESNDRFERLGSLSDVETLPKMEITAVIHEEARDLLAVEQDVNIEEGRTLQVKEDNDQYGLNVTNSGLKEKKEPEMKTNIQEELSTNENAVKQKKDHEELKEHKEETEAKKLAKEELKDIENSEKIKTTNEQLQPVEKTELEKTTELELIANEGAENKKKAIEKMHTKEESEKEVLKSLPIDSAKEEAMAHGTLESLRGTALIERQEVLESGITTDSYVLSISDRGDRNDEGEHPRLESLTNPAMAPSCHTDDGLLLKNANVGLHSELEAIVVQNNVAEYNVASLVTSCASPTVADQSVQTALAIALKEHIDEQELMETLSDVDSLSKIEDIKEECDKGSFYPEATITLTTHDAVTQRIISAQSVPTQIPESIIVKAEARGTIEAALGIAQIESNDRFEMFGSLSDVKTVPKMEVTTVIHEETRDLLVVVQGVNIEEGRKLQNKEENDHELNLTNLGLVEEKVPESKANVQEELHNKEGAVTLKKDSEKLKEKKEETEVKKKVEDELKAKENAKEIKSPNEQLKSKEKADLESIAEVELIANETAENKRKEEVQTIEEREDLKRPPAEAPVNNDRFESLSSLSDVETLPIMEITAVNHEEARDLLAVEQDVYIEEGRKSQIKEEKDPHVLNLANSGLKEKKEPEKKTNIKEDLNNKKEDVILKKGNKKLIENKKETETKKKVQDDLKGKENAEKRNTSSEQSKSKEKTGLEKVTEVELIANEGSENKGKADEEVQIKKEIEREDLKRLPVEAAGDNDRFERLESLSDVETLTKMEIPAVIYEEARDLLAVEQVVNIEEGRKNDQHGLNLVSSELIEKKESERKTNIQEDLSNKVEAKLLTKGHKKLKENKRETEVKKNVEDELKDSENAEKIKTPNEQLKSNEKSGLEKVTEVELIANERTGNKKNADEDVRIKEEIEREVLKKLPVEGVGNNDRCERLGSFSDVETLPKMEITAEIHEEARDLLAVQQVPNIEEQKILQNKEEEDQCGLNLANSGLRKNKEPERKAKIQEDLSNKEEAVKLKKDQLKENKKETEVKKKVEDDLKDTENTEKINRPNEQLKSNEKCLLEKIREVNVIAKEGAENEKKADADVQTKEEALKNDETEPKVKEGKKLKSKDKADNKSKPKEELRALEAGKRLELEDVIAKGEAENKAESKSSAANERMKTSSADVSKQVDEVKLETILERSLDAESSSRSGIFSEYRVEPTKLIKKESKKPEFSMRLTDCTTARNTRIRLNCSVVGNPEPSVKWLRDGTPILIKASDSKRISTSFADGVATLAIQNAQSGDSGEYSCVARNSGGEISTSCVVKVFSSYEPEPHPPEFTRPISDAYKLLDDTLTLECHVKSQPAAKVSWLRNGRLIEAKSRYQQTETSDGICQLTIFGPETNDDGEYICRAENSINIEETSSTVQFKGRQFYTDQKELNRRSVPRPIKDYRRPHFASELTDHLVTSGGTVALQVEVKGIPHPEVQWLRGSDVLPRASSHIRTFEDSGLYTLLVSNASDREAGTYTCRAFNNFGFVDTTAAVEVIPAGAIRGGKAAHLITKPGDFLTVAEEDDLILTCRVGGEPRPRVVWMKGVRDITVSQRSMVEHSDDYYRFTLKRCTPADAGTYWIIVKNAYGTDRAFITVSVRHRARSLTPGNFLSKSASSSSVTSELLSDIHDRERYSRKETPGPITSEPIVADCGKNWLTLSWKKPSLRGAGPVVAYRVDAWELGEDGGARWVELGISPVNTYDAFNLKEGREYKFRITPRNRYGWGEPLVTSRPILVGFKPTYLPEFTKILPGQLKALLGATIRLECQVDCDATPGVGWHRDGAPLDLSNPRLSTRFDGKTCQLIIEDLQEEDSGRYMCEAVNQAGRVSTFARLSVVSDPKIWAADNNLRRGVVEEEGANLEAPPQFTMRLRDRRVQQTYPVRLTCQVLGRPYPSVLWSKDGVEIKQDERHTFWNDDHFFTLEITKSTLEDSGVYAVQARNVHGAVACRCHLVVDKGIRAYVAPEFVGELDLVRTVKVGGELRLQAQVEAYPTVGVVWHRDSTKLRPSRRILMTLDYDGMVELAIAAVTERDAGVYTCTATNAVGRCETTCRVSIQQDGSVGLEIPTIQDPQLPYSKAPLFLKKPRSTDAIEGDSVIIECEVVGDPKPDVFWLRDFLKPDYYRDAPLFRRVGDGPAYRLEIPHVKLDHTGTYSLVARNAHGEAKAIISLQVYVKGLGKDDGMHRRPVTRGNVETLPAFKKGLKDLRCCDGDAVTLECEVEGGAGADVRWERGGKLVRLGGDVLSEFDGRIARLTINHVYPEDEGEYTCVAFNDLGHTATSACLLVDVPEEKENALSKQLHRPTGLLSGGSTPRSTPRTTPSRSMSPYTRSFSPRHLEPISTPKRPKVAAPKFYAIPHNRVAEEGETVRFQCAIAGHPSPWATWDKNGILVTPSTRISLTERDDLRVLEISEVTVEDAGLYRITLENDVGRVEATARLEVIGPHGYKTKVANRAHSASPRTSPSFRRRLVGGIGRLGDRINLACDIRGAPSPVPSWYRNGELIVMTDRLVPTWDGTTAMLEISEVVEDDEGVYTCKATNELGRAQCSAQLEVVSVDDPRATEPPQFVKGLSEATLQEGAPAELIVQIQGSTPMDVVWVRDGIEIPDCPDFHHVDYGNGRFGLRFADVFSEDTGHYTCEVFNQYGEMASEADIIVKDCCSTTPRLVLSKKPTSVVVTCGRNASFCARLQSASKGPAPFTTPTLIRWAIGDLLVKPDPPSKYMVEEDGDVSILHVSGVERRDAGQVTVVAQAVCPSCRDADLLSAVLSCSCGPVTTATADLTVLPDNWASDGEADLSPPVRMRSRSLSTSEIEVDLPKISRAMTGFIDESPALLLRGPADLNVLQGEKVVLSATYCGQPEPVVRWLRGGHEMKDGNRVHIETGDGMSSLTITSITSDDSGKYVVSVENVLGADCHFASVSVEGPPDPPAGRPTVSPCSPTSVNVAWSSPHFDGGHKLLGYKVEAQTSASNAWVSVSDATDSLSTTIINLNAGETYRFRVRAVNIHGDSEPGPESELCPLACQAEPEDLPVPVTIQTGEDFKARYNVLEELGKGRYGVVHKVVDTITTQKLAAKFIRVIKLTDREKVKEEIEIMSSLRHPKLLQLAAAFESPREVVMVMEYISGGELFERVVADDFQLTERDCILFMRQICEGVAYMHSSQVVHLDLKPENIMCQTRTSHEIKLIDFGLAQRLIPETPVRVLFGTPEFVPPEIINYEPIGLESDMWSVGVVCYVLLSGLSPFMGETDAETFANITRADFDFDDDAFDAISTDAKDFISSLLVKRKEKRLSATECLRNKWMLSEHEQTMAVVLSTDKLKKFIIRRKWQKTGNAIRALGRMANLSAASRRNSSASSTGSSPRPSIAATSRLSDKLIEEVDEKNRGRFASERSDSGFSDCSTATATSNALLSHENSIAERDEVEISPKSNGRRVSSEMDDKVEDIRKKFANLSQNIYEMDKKLESVGKQLGDIGPIRINPKKAEIQRTPSLKETKVPSLTIPKSPELLTSRLARSREQTPPTSRGQTPNRIKGIDRTPPHSRGHTPTRSKDATPPHSRGHTPPRVKSTFPKNVQATTPHARGQSPAKTNGSTTSISVRGTKTSGVNSKRDDFLRLQRMYDSGAVGQSPSLEGKPPASQAGTTRSRTSPTFHKTVAFWKR